MREARAVVGGTVLAGIAAAALGLAFRWSVASPSRPGAVGILPLQGLPFGRIVRVVPIGGAEFLVPIRGVELLLLVGLALGVMGLLLRPGPALRLAALGSLALGAIGLNLAWFGPLDQGRDNRNYSFSRRYDARLATQYLVHYHSLVQRKAGHFTLPGPLRGKPIHYVEGFTLQRRNLLVLNQVSEIVDLPRPSVRLPSARKVLARYPVSEVKRGKYRFASILEGSASAAYFVAVKLDDTDFFVPGPVWEEWLARGPEGGWWGR